MSEDGWSLVDAALAAAASPARPLRLWLRDDDAVEATPALDRLAALCEPAGLPVLLAVIPAGATPGLARWLAAHPSILPCQHGWSHANHAAAGERACELGGDRPDSAVLGELGRGRARLRELVGDRAAAILVPPWNRLRASLVPALPVLGYGALSVFAGRPLPDTLPRVDPDLDLIDWRNGRRGRGEAELCGRLAALISAAGPAGRAVGLLTHHLAHDEAAWHFLTAALRHLGSHPHVQFTDAAAELRRGPDQAPPPPQ